MVTHNKILISKGQKFDALLKNLSVKFITILPLKTTMDDKLLDMALNKVNSSQTKNDEVHFVHDSTF
jgi:hypothetical protein